MRKMIFSMILFTFLSFFKSQINGYEFWFDRDVGNKTTYTFTSPSNLVFINRNIPTSNLVNGLHVLNFRTKDTNNKYSSIITDFFYKASLVSNTNKNIIAYQYCFDRDFNNAIYEYITPAQSIEINKIIDISELNDGLHIISFRVKDDAGNWSEITTDFFYKISFESVNYRSIIAYQYAIDKDFKNSVIENVTPTQILEFNKIINVSSLKDGLHIISFRFLDNYGAYSSITTDFFYKISENDIIGKNIVEYQYWIDKDFASAILENISPIAILDVNKSINLSSLKDGIHLFNVRFKDDTGNWSSISTQFFTKNSGNILSKNIVGYEYWFNDDYEKVVKKQVEPIAEFSLNTFILPENLVTRYNNVFNIRFKDDSGEWSSIISEVFEDITLATAENTLKNVIFYPNPFENNLFINLGKSYHKIDVEIFDISGRTVFQQKFTNKDIIELNLKLTSGIYQLVLKADDKVTSKKILKR